MSYVDVRYYRCYTGNKTIDKYMIEAAADKINELCFNRISAKGFNNLTPFQQGLIKKAVCRQAEYYNEYGVDCETISGFSTPDISMNFKDGGNGTPKGVSPLAYGLLRQTGLMHRGFGI